MKKGFLFGFGVLLAGSVIAATISTVSIDTKTPGDTVTNQEFNEITTGIGSVTDVFKGTTSTDTSITIPKEISATKVSAPQLCIGNDCQSTWPAGGEGGGAGVTAKVCPSGQQLQSVSADGEFTCGVDQTGEAGTGDEMGLHIATLDILPEMTGAQPLLGNPPGSPEVVSRRNIGSETQWFHNLWVEDLHVGNQSLYMNGVKILESDPTIEMRFTADEGQAMTILTKRDPDDGTPGVLSLKSEDDLNLEVIAGDNTRSLNIKNNSTNGTIEIATKTPGVGSSSKISLTSPIVRLGEYPISKTGINLAPASTPAYTLDVNGDINFTGTLYENGVAFGGGGESLWTKSTDYPNTIYVEEGTKVGINRNSPGKTLDVNGDINFTGNLYKNDTLFGASPWTETSGKVYYGGNVGIGGVNNPLVTLDASNSGGTVLTRKICLADDTVTTSPHTKVLDGQKNSLCFTKDSILSVADLFQKSENGPGLGASNSENCSATTAGKTRIANPFGGTAGAAVAFQVCMYNQHSETWYWMTLIDSNVGIPAGGGTCNPDSGVCDK